MHACAVRKGPGLLIVRSIGQALSRHYDRHMPVHLAYQLCNVESVCSQRVLCQQLQLL
jgi:hypothetical protein